MNTTLTKQEDKANKEGMLTLQSFLNDSCWMENYGYKTFSNVEIQELYKDLKNEKKLNLPREVLVSYALKKFPHRCANKSSNNIKRLTLLSGALILIITALVILFK
jgi:hypothetical protein